MKRKESPNIVPKSRKPRVTQIVQIDLSDLEQPIIGKTDNILEAFLFPMTKEKFMNEIYAKKPFVTKNGSIDRFKSIVKKYLFNLDVEELLEETASDSIHIWLRNSGSGDIQSFQMEDTDKAKILYDAGASLYFRTPPNLEKSFVSQFCTSLGYDFGGFFAPQHSNDVQRPRGEIETFLSRKGHVTEWHFDFMENFTFQLQGRKKWTLKSSDMFEVTRGYTPHYKVHDTKEQQLKLHTLQNANFDTDSSNFVGEEIILEPGDVMYFPSGYWHRVECEEDSISINVSLFPMRWMDLVIDGVKTMLHSDDKWRSSIIIDSIDSARSYCDDLLKDLKSKVSRLTSEDLLPDGIQMENIMGTKALNEKSLFVVNPISVLINCDGKWILHSNFGNEEVSSSLRVELDVSSSFDPVLSWIQKQNTQFAVGEILKEAKLPLKKVSGLLQVLIHYGHIRSIE